MAKKPIDHLGFGVADNRPYAGGNPFNLGFNPMAADPLVASVSDTQINTKLLEELRYIIADVLAGDKDARERPEYACLGLENIKLALDWLNSNGGLAESAVSNLMEEPWRLVYRARPPTPAEFLTQHYIGPQAESMYAPVSNAFIEAFDPLKPYRTVVLTPHIGWGKSLFTVLANLYVSVCVSLMWAPYKFFGQSPSTVYTQVFCAESQKKSSELLFEPMLNILESAEFFQKCRTQEDMKKADQDFDNSERPDHIFWTTATPTSVIQMSNGANYKLISSPNGLLGQTIIMGSMTEIGFFTDNGFSEEYVKKFFTKLRGRINSRMLGNYYGRFILDSSPNTMESVIDKWIWEEAALSKANYIVSGSKWKHYPAQFPDFYDKDGNIVRENAFPLFKGGNGSLPCVVEEGSEGSYDKVDLILCPKRSVELNFMDMARENPIEFMRDYCGIPSGAADRIFYNKSLVENIFVDKMKNMYAFISAPSTEQPEHLIWNQIRDQFFYKLMESYHFWYAPELPRTLSVDQSYAEDVTCIALSHVERDPNHVDPQTKDMLPIYVTDMTIVIIPKGGRINLDAIRYFVMDLVSLGNMRIHKISFDQFQSQATIQGLERAGFDVEKLSVDSTNDPYLNFIDLIEKGRYKVGRSISFKNNLLALQMQKRNKGKGTVKIDHVKGDLCYDWPTGYSPKDPMSWKQSWDTCLTGQFAKDVADAACASVELLRKSALVPIKVWEPERIVERNLESVRTDLKAMLESRGLS